MKNKYNIIIVYLLFNCFIIYSQSNTYNTRKLSNCEGKVVLINMGIQNIPDLYYDYYFTFPNNIEEMCSFIENHYDYKDYLKEMWEPAINYLRKNKSKIRIISNHTKFIIYSREKISYNENNICSTISMHYPESEYLRWKNKVEFFDSNSKNIKEKLGVDFSDTLKSSFNLKIKEVLNNHNTEYVISKNKRFIDGSYDRVLLKFTKTEGIQPFCENEGLNILNINYIQELNLVCRNFCNDNNIDKIIFCSFIVL
ncbi:MAG: hypothetical protein Q7U47_11815 [Paludibacter sp.]|nr:hypothetical protein [Paludibacter sp.]